MKTWWIYLLLCLSYVVSGKLGLMLALPPGYVSPIFPPAGIAVAAALIGGRRTLPWVFAGSLLLNLWVGYASSQQPGAMVVASLIAAASTLQAAAGGWALRRAIGYPVRIDCGSEVLRFLLLAPLICLVSASLSVSGLWALGIVNWIDFSGNWAAWWIGDTLGVLVVLPLVMIAAGEPRALWRSRRLTVAAPILLVFALFVALFLRVNQWENSDALMEFRQLSQQSVNQIQNKFEEQEFLLEETASLFLHDRTDRVKRDEFHRFVGKTLLRFPMLHALEWATPVDAADRAAFEAAQRREVPGFEIRERDDAGQLRRAGSRARYYPLTYIEPLAGNEHALGFDLASNPKRRAALIEALQCGTAVATPAVRLVQGQVGVLLLMAIDPHDDKSGAVLTVLSVGDFMDRLSKSSRDMLYTRMIDLDAGSTLYDNFASASQPALYRHDFEFGTRHYRMETAPTPLYYRLHRGWQSWGVLVAGILGTGLLCALLLLGTGHTARIEAQVEARTRELSESRQRLQEAQRMAQIGSWSMEGDVLSWSDETYRIFEIDPASLSVSYKIFLDAIHPEDRDRVDSAYSESVRNHTAYDIEHRLLFPDGRIKFVHEHCETFYDAAGQAIRSVGTVQDITERKMAEERIRNLAFYDTLTQLPNRRLLHDRLEQAIVVNLRNDRYAALMVLDLDNFKSLNDTYGHMAGDQLLVEAAGRLKNCVRASDTVARFGGDEFVVLLNELNGGLAESVAQAHLVAEKIRISLSHPYLVAVKNDGEEVIVEHLSTASIGVVVFGRRPESEENILRWADAAMYQAKKDGRNRIRFHQADS